MLKIVFLWCALLTVTNSAKPPVCVSLCRLLGQQGVSGCDCVALHAQEVVSAATDVETTNNTSVIPPEPTESDTAETEADAEEAENNAEIASFFEDLGEEGDFFDHQSASKGNPIEDEEEDESDWLDGEYTASEELQ